MTSTVLDTAAPTARPGWWAARFGGLPRPFWVLFGGLAAARLGFFVVPFLPYWLVAERDLTTAQAAGVMTAFGIGWATSMPLGGWLADRLGRRHVIVASGFGAAGAYLALAAVHDQAALLAGALFVGATFDLYRPAVQAAMTDAVEPDSRGRALGLLYLGMNASRMLACALGGVLADNAFAILFVANAAINIAFGVMVYRTVPEKSVTNSAATSTSLRILVRDRRFAAFCLITLVFFTIHMQSMVALPAVLAGAGATPLVYGLLLALDPLVVVIVQLTVIERITRAAPLTVCAIGVTTVGVGLAITGMAPNLGWMAATIPLWVVGEVLYLPAAYAVVAILAPEHSRGLYFGTWGATQGGAAVVAPLLATSLASLGALDLVWIAGAIGGAICGLACLTLANPVRSRRRVAPHQ